ncbi:MAG: hypothetical protein LBV23_05295 [Deltaproteobacteria bacterium]|jgi:rod shape-determining protein MreD|nr:hypothetical protein [Deltaproteobacteria bacterium]
MPFEQQVQSATLRLAQAGLILLLGLVLASFTSLPTFVRLVPWGRPQWVALLGLYLALRSEVWLGSAGCLILGVFKDALTLNPNGLESLGLILSLQVVVFLTKFMKFSSAPSLFLLILAIISVKKIIFFPLFMTITTGRMDFDLSLAALLTWLVESATTAFIGPFLFSLLDNFFFRREVERS